MKLKELNQKWKCKISMEDQLVSLFLGNQKFLFFSGQCFRHTKYHGFTSFSFSLIFRFCSPQILFLLEFHERDSNLIASHRSKPAIPIIFYLRKAIHWRCTGFNRCQIVLAFNTTSIWHGEQNGPLCCCWSDKNHFLEVVR